MIEILSQSGKILFSFSGTGIIITTAILWLIGIGLFVLTGFGLRKMAVNRDVGKSYFAFIPALRWVLITKIAGEIKMFQKKANGWLGITMAVLSLVYFVTMLIVELAFNMPLILHANQGSVVLIQEIKEGAYTYFQVMSKDYAIYTDLAKQIITGLQYAVIVLTIIYLIGLMLIASALFKSYAPMQSLLFTILSVIPILLFANSDICGFYVGAFGYTISVFGIIIFALRNKPVVDYKKYIINRYGAPRQQRYGKEDIDPFSDDGSKNAENDDPFSDFYNDGDNESK